MTVSPHRSAPAIRSLQSGLVHLLFYLFVRRSNWVFVYLDFFYFGVWPDDILPTQNCVHYWFRQLWILLTFGSVYLGFYPTWCLSTWILSTWESCHMTFYPGRIVSTIGSVNSRFCLHVVLSTLESVHLRVWLLGICPLWSLASWHSANVGFCSLLVLSTLDSAHIWFGLLGIMFIKDFFYLRLCPLSILFTCVLVYLDSVLFGVWPHDILPT